jgi:sugar phosphate isomerase/epimerase
MREGLAMKLSCQEHMIPGETMLAKWQTISALGYDGIELRGGGDEAFTARLPELRDARRQGARYSSICGILPVFPGDFDASKRREAIARIRVLLMAAADLGAAGVVSPAAYGIHSNALPPFAAPRTPVEDEAILLEAFGEAAEHAAREGVAIWIEPLNRYEDHMINRLEQAASLCETIGLDSMGVLADLFHMGLEEVSSADALVASKRWVKHLHGADSNRFEPGAGQTDFEAIRRALATIGYTGSIALECRLSGDPLEALRRTAGVLSGEKV